MKKIKDKKGMLVPLIAMVFLTIYVISDNNFAIYDSGMSLFVINLALLLFSLAVGFFIQIIIHELGHLVFGLLASYQFSSFRILNFLFIKENGKVKLERLHVPGTAGQCLMKPKNKDMSLASAITFNLGGGLFNIIISILMIVFHNRFLQGTSFSMESRAIYSMGFFAALTNLVPLKVGAIANDGYNALMLWRDKESVKIFNETLLIQDYITHSNLYKDIPSQLLYFNESFDYNNPIYTGSLAFFNESLLDDENYEESYRISFLALKQFPEMIDHYKNYFKTNVLFLDILNKQDTERLKDRFEKIKLLAKQTPNSPSYLRIQYAYYSLVEINTNLASIAKTNFHRYLKVVPFKSDIKIETQGFDLIEKILEEREESVIEVS